MILFNALFKGEKRVLLSPTSKNAHIIVESRETAFKIIKKIQSNESAINVLGSNVEIKLVKPEEDGEMKANLQSKKDDIEIFEMKDNNVEILEKNEIEAFFDNGFVIDEKFCQNIVNVLIKAKSPVLLQFGLLLTKVEHNIL